MSDPDQEPPSSSPATPLRTFLVVKGPGLDAELARQAGPGGVRPDDVVIVMSSPNKWTLPNGQVVRWLREDEPQPVLPWDVIEDGAQPLCTQGALNGAL